MKNSIFRPEVHCRLALGWLACTMALLIALIVILPDSRLNSSVMALLPDRHVEDVPPGLEEGFNQRLERQLVWLITSPDEDDSAPAAWWQEQLQQMPTLRDIAGRMDESHQHSWGKFYFDHRYQLLDDATRERLNASPSAQVDWVLSQVYSPFAAVSAAELSDDPLLTMRSSQMDQRLSADPLTLSHGWLTSRDERERTWFLIRGELNASSYDIHSARQTVEQLNELKTQLERKWPGAEVLQRGTLFYSDYASQQAQNDISTIGTVSGLCIIVLILLVFRSLKPLWLTFLSLTVGALCGSVAVLALFGEIHIMTLVMSTSVVGISIDYALHYLTERLIHGNEDSALVSMKKLFPALILAVISSTVAYLLLFIAPFPGLQQLAIFAAAGLSGAFLTVICWYPTLSRLRVRPHLRPAFFSHWINGWRHQKAIRFGIPLLALAVTVVCVSQLRIDDDIRKLQDLPPELQQQERQIEALTGQHSDQKWFMVFGDSAQQTLQRLESLDTALEVAKREGVLQGYRRMPFPSQQRQRSNIALINLYAPDVVQKLQNAGLPVRFTPLADVPASLDDWLKSPASEGWRMLWLSLSDGCSAVLVPVNGVKSPEALRYLADANAGVVWVDRHGEFSSLFSVYRQHLTTILIVTVAVIGLLFLFRFGLRQGIRCLIPTLLSLGMGLAVLGLSGQTLNLFSLLALVLVLGIGMDYTLFFSNPSGTPSTSMLSVFMAALTTELSFGLLAASGTQAISGFGLVLSGGIFAAFLLSPLALPCSPLNNTPVEKEFS